MKTSNTPTELPKKYKSVEAFIEAKLNDANESVKKLDFSLIKKKMVEKTVG